MGVVLRTLGKISSIAASVFTFAGSPILGAAFTANANIMNNLADGNIIGAFTGMAGTALTQKRPPTQGATNTYLIGANLPSVEGCGECYFAGQIIHDTAYGGENGVENAYRWLPVVYSVGGPVEQLVQIYADFTPINFSGTAATGYYSNNTLYRDFQLGADNEDALNPHWGGAPDWSSAHKISNKAAIGFNARRPKDGKRYGGGFPAMGAVWKWAKCYDPRYDSTYPGGSGPHRWADPQDTAAFAAARLTWTWTANPAIRALRYALGTWERNEADSAATYRKVFGIGGGIDQVVLADFVEAANVDDANGWTANGMLFEGKGISKFDNLKRIGMAGGFEPVFKGARLGLRVQAPRVPVAIITMADIGEGEPSAAANLPYEDRINTLRPYFISADHKWESTPTETAVQVIEYVDQDGEEKAEDWPFDLVTNPTQAAQLTGYELVRRREQPFSLPLLKRFPAGSLVEFAPQVVARYGLQQDQAEQVRRTSDLGNMKWTGEFITENPGKHLFALALTGSSPPVPSIPTPEDRDTAALPPGSNSVPSDLAGLSVSSNVDGTLIDTDWAPSDFARDYLVELIPVES